MATGAVHEWMYTSVFRDGSDRKLQVGAMMKTLTSALLLSAALLAAPAHASVQAPSGDSGAAQYQQSLISEREAVNAARQAYPQASAINARLVNSSRPFYVVRMQEGSRLFDVRVDAQTGRVLN